MATSTKGEDTYIAQPPGPCCWLGTIHKGTPRGTMESILDVPTYVAKPAADKANGHVVLYLPDVWGISNNAKLLMDGFADAGFLTLGMDYFRDVSTYSLFSVMHTLSLSFNTGKKEYNKKERKKL